MKLSNFIEGLQIIRNHEKHEFCLRAERDQIWVSQTELPLTAEESSRLEELGWFKDDRADGWSAFV